MSLTASKHTNTPLRKTQTTEVKLWQIVKVNTIHVWRDGLSKISKYIQNSAYREPYYKVTLWLSTLFLISKTLSILISCTTDTSVAAALSQSPFFPTVSCHMHIILKCLSEEKKIILFTSTSRGKKSHFLLLCYSLLFQSVFLKGAENGINYWHFYEERHSSIVTIPMKMYVFVDT